MLLKGVLGSAAFVIAASTCSATTLASSGFDASAEGWSAANGARSFAWVATGGDPDGYISARELRGETLWYFVAPADYLGDVGSAYGGTLSYRLKSDGSSAPLETAYADVQLLGSNGVRLAYNGGVAPTADWSQYGVSLVADGSWRVDSLSGAVATAADLQGVLSGLQELRIRGDYFQAVETTGLDSVVLTAVPEPASALLMLGGLGLLAAVARRS